MNKCVFLLSFMMINSYAFSNDSRTILGSSVEIIDNKNTNIIMQEETINITLHKGYYEVDVTFDFYNSGADEVVLLGFPVKTTMQNFPENNKWAVLENFKSFINEKPVPDYVIKEERKVSSPGAYSSAYDYITTTKWYLREVTFPGKEHTYSHVVYRAPYNNRGFYENAGYIFGTGRNWKGTIGKMTIIINHNDDILIDRVAVGKNKDFLFSWEANGKYKYILENIEPEINESIYIGITPFDIYGEYHNELGDMSEGWIWNEYLLYANINDIRLFTKNQIRLFINFFYAFHGYEFKNQLYKNYFHGFDKFMDLRNTKYVVNPDFSENDFNEFERKNIDYLLRLEKMIP